jgi:hypothetical protein
MFIKAFKWIFLLLDLFLVYLRTLSYLKLYMVLNYRMNNVYELERVKEEAVAI